jgi:hypothetical protein
MLMDKSMEEIELENLEAGEKFRFGGEVMTVLENQGTRYVLCERGSEVIHLSHDYLVQPID